MAAKAKGEAVSHEKTWRCPMQRFLSLAKQVSAELWSESLSSYCRDFINGGTPLLDGYGLVSFQ